MSAGPPIRRRFRVTIEAEGHSWHDAGTAAAEALIRLQETDPKTLDEEPLDAGGGSRTGDWGFRVEASSDPKMTPEAYRELVAAAGRIVGPGERK
jgi:hypothetical protein